MFSLYTIHIMPMDSKHKKEDDDKEEEESYPVNENMLNWFLRAIVVCSFGHFSSVCVCA